MIFANSIVDLTKDLLGFFDVKAAQQWSRNSSLVKFAVQQQVMFNVIPDLSCQVAIFRQPILLLIDDNIVHPRRLYIDRLYRVSLCDTWFGDDLDRDQAEKLRISAGS